MATREPTVFVCYVFFDFDSAELSDNSRAALDDLVGNIRAHHYIQTIVIEGYTDNLGADAYNKKLSMRRAEVVKKYFIERNINPPIFSVAGNGSSRPIAPNTTNGKDNPRGRAKNRRTEIEASGFSS